MSQAGSIRGSGSGGPGSDSIFNTTPVTIDLTKSGATLIYTVPTGKTFFPLFMYINTISNSDDGANALVSFGTNATNYDNISGIGSVLTAPNGPSLAGTYSVNTPGSVAEAFTLPTSGQTVYFNVQTHSTNTTNMVNVFMTGYFLT